MLNPDGKLTIDLGTLAQNYRHVQKKVGEACIVAPVVKANAFGLGAKEVTGALIAAGCQNFFVAKPLEALELREHYPDISLYILNGFYEDYAQDYVDHRLIPVIGSFMEVEEYTALGKTLGRRLPAYLKFNTRMNRLGFGSVEQEELWKNPQRLDGIEVTGVMSHLACADETDQPMNATQLSLFQNIVQHFPHAKKSLANSYGTFAEDNFTFDMVRTGAALYGLNPTPDRPNPMAPVVSLQVPVIRSRIVFEGAAVGYGATYRFEKQSPLVTISAGYADGLFRSLSNVGALYWQGIRCPIRGCVSMDLTTVDCSDVPEGQRPKPGDMMEILGPHQSADALAHDAGTIGYEILTNLGARYQRQYIGGA